MTLLTGINHAALLTSDLDRLVEFYVAVFDAEVVFQETTPEFRHAMLQIAPGIVLHPAEMHGNPHAVAIPTMFQRGHLDHVGLNVASAEAFSELRRRLVARGASDGQIADLGAQLSLWFTDPDGMRAELCWTLDPWFRSVHGPQPISEETFASLAARA